jgi:hypothetical protein
MKTRLLILFILAYVSAYAQPPTGSYTLINQRYNWLGGYFRGLGIPVGCDTSSAFLSGQWRGAGAVYYDSCDAKFYIWNQYWREVQGSGGGGSGGLSGGNLGFGFRLYDYPFEGIRTLFNSYGYNWDSTSNSYGLTGTIDTTLIATRAIVQKRIDSLAALGGGGSGIGAIYTQYGITKVNDSTVRADTTVGAGLIGWPRWLKLRDSLEQKIPIITAGTNITITGTFPTQQIDGVSDTNWVFLSTYGTPNDGLSDTAAIKAAVATGKNVYVTPGEWLWDGYRCTLNSNQIIRGYGPTSIIRFTQDIVDVFHIPQSTHHVQIDYIKFIGKGRGAAPGGEVFTLSNAIFIQGDSNRVQYCDFKAVKGSGIHAWVASGTMYANEVSYCRFDSCGVGIYALNNAEYSLFLANQAYYCRWGFYERCAGNNTWDAFTSNYNDLGFGLLGSSGCNGDHGSVSNARINHNTAALDVRQCNNEYVFQNVKFYNGTIAIGSLDTAKRVLFDNCVLSGNVFTVTKSLNCQFSGGTFGTTAVTIVGSDDDEYFTFCNVQNSPYSATTCGGSAGLTNPMTTAEDIIVGGVGGTPTRFAKGANGTFLGYSGGTLQALSLPGGGDVSKVGTPADNQVGVWTGDGTIEGTSGLTYNGTIFGVTGAGTFSSTITSSKLIGGTGTTDDLELQSTSGVGATGAEIRFKVGNNGATTAMTINNAGEVGIGTAPASTFKLFVVSAAAGAGTTHTLFRNSSSQNILQISDLGDTRIGNQSASTSVNNLYNKTFAGGATTPTAWMHLGASVTGTASLRIPNGTPPSSPNEGDVWQASNHLMFRSNDGVTYQLDQQGGFSNPLTTTGDIIYSSSGTTAARRAIGSTGDVLTVSGGVPAWVAPTITAQGTWTPTIAGLANVASSNGPTGIYSRQGNVVTFSIWVLITPTAGSTNTSFTATLPIASDLVNATDVIGNATGTQNVTYGAGFVTAAPSTDVINIQFSSVNTSAHSLYITGQYTIQ